MTSLIGDSLYVIEISLLSHGLSVVSNESTTEVLLFISSDRGIVGGSSEPCILLGP